MIYKKKEFEMPQEGLQSMTIKPAEKKTTKILLFYSVRRFFSEKHYAYP
jgi:hypothetical protein